MPRLLDNGGNILMIQVENEYGSYGEDKSYLRAIRKLMEDRGLIALFTSDGPWGLLKSRNLDRRRSLCDRKLRF